LHFDVPAVLDARNGPQVSMFAPESYRLVHAPEVSAADSANLRTSLRAAPMYGS